MERSEYKFICCRFQILRELLPENDQKRDKATLLLEVCYSSLVPQILLCYLTVICKICNCYTNSLKVSIILIAGYTVYPLFTGEVTNV